MGKAVEVHKVKWADAVSLLDHAKGNLSNLLGCQVAVSYNKYGKVSSVTVIK